MGTHMVKTGLLILACAVAVVHTLPMLRQVTTVTVECKFTIDNHLNGIELDGVPITFTGNAAVWAEVKVATFTRYDNQEGGSLRVYGYNWEQYPNGVTGCSWAGFLMTCTADDTASPWHNFHSNTANWQASTIASPPANPNINLSPPAITSDALYALALGFSTPCVSTSPFYMVNTQLAPGAQKIWVAGGHNVALFEAQPGGFGEYTCSDGLLNQGEIEVDCGGPCDSCSGGGWER